MFYFFILFCLGEILVFCFGFWDRVLLCCSEWFQTSGYKWSSHFSLSSSWYYRYIPPYPAMFGCFVLFWCWNLNSGPCACHTGAVPLSYIYPGPMFVLNMGKKRKQCVIDSKLLIDICLLCINKTSSVIYCNCTNSCGKLLISNSGCCGPSYCFTYF